MERMNHLPFVGCSLDRTHSQAVSEECLDKLTNLFKWINSTLITSSHLLPSMCFFLINCLLNQESLGPDQLLPYTESPALGLCTPGSRDSRSEGPKPREKHHGLAHPCMGKCCCDDGSLWLVRDQESHLMYLVTPLSCLNGPWLTPTPGAGCFFCYRCFRKSQGTVFMGLNICSCLWDNKGAHNCPA